MRRHTLQIGLCHHFGFHLTDRLGHSDPGKCRANNLLQTLVLDSEFIGHGVHSLIVWSRSKQTLCKRLRTYFEVAGGNVSPNPRGYGINSKETDASPVAPEPNSRNTQH